MADFADNISFADATAAIAQGKRHLLVRDYNAAVTAFAEGLEMLSRKYGDCGDELGEPYLLYGRALLSLARVESGVLGNGVLGSDEIENDDDSVNMEDSLSNIEEKEDEGNLEQESEHIIDDNKHFNKHFKSRVLPSNDDLTEISEECNKNESLMKHKQSTELTNNSPGSSKDQSKYIAYNEAVNSSTGTEENDVNIHDDVHDPERGIDLQVAWEVLELAKNVFSKRGHVGYKYLAEAYRLLGEVAMESGNHQVAVSDLKQSLKILENLEPHEFRAVAEIHYQLGLAHLLLNDFDTSIEQFNEAMNLLKCRIKQLEDSDSVLHSNDPFYSIDGEIKELEELLPEIQEKITDIKDFKQETCQIVIKGIKTKVTDYLNESDSNVSFVHSSADSTTENIKPVSDISHLVRKKRRTEGLDDQNTSLNKKI